MKKPAPVAPSPSFDLQRILESGKVAEIAEKLGGLYTSLYGQFEGGFVRGMTNAMRSARKARMSSRARGLKST